MNIYNDFDFPIQGTRNKYMSPFVNRGCTEIRVKGNKIKYCFTYFAYLYDIIQTILLKGTINCMNPCNTA